MQLHHPCVFLFSDFFLPALKALCLTFQCTWNQQAQLKLILFIPPLPDYLPSLCFFFQLSTNHKIKTWGLLWTSLFHLWLVDPQDLAYCPFNVLSPRSQSSPHHHCIFRSPLIHRWGYTFDDIIHLPKILQRTSCLKDKVHITCASCQPSPTLFHPHPPHPHSPPCAWTLCFPHVTCSFLFPCLCLCYFLSSHNAFSRPHLINSSSSLKLIQVSSPQNLLCTPHTQPRLSIECVSVCPVILLYVCPSDSPKSSKYERTRQKSTLGNLIM